MRQISRSSVVTALVVVVLALLAFALLFALRPYHHRAEVSLERDDATATFTVTGTCATAIASAWNRSARDELRLWAVTVGTDEMDYVPASGRSVRAVLTGDDLSPRFPDSWCGGESRHRLIVAGWVLLAALGGGIAIAVVARRDT